MPTVTIDGMKQRIGSEIVSDWVEVTQAMIDGFAKATGDHQFIHVDPVRAAQTPFAGTIAHGFLTLSLLAGLAQQSDWPQLDGASMSVNYGLDKVRFLTAVPSGAKVRGRFTLRAFAERRAGQFQQVLDCIIEIDGQEKPAVIAEWIGQTFVQP